MLKSVITVESRKLEFQVRLIQAMTLKLRINHGSVLFQLNLLILDGLAKNNEALTAYDRQVLPELLRVRNQITCLW